MSPRRRTRPRNGFGSGRGMVKLISWLIVLLGALSLVTWRQPRGVEMERALRSLEADLAIAEAERTESLRHIEELRSRARILSVATSRLGMHIPDDSEIVFLPRAAGIEPGGQGDGESAAKAERVASVGGGL